MANNTEIVREPEAKAILRGWENAAEGYKEDTK